VQQPPTRRLQRPPTEGPAAQRLLRPGAPGVIRPAQDGADAGQQLTRVERLGEVVVGAELQADDAIRLLPHSCQHDDRHFALAAQPTSQIEPGLARQHQVEHDQLVVAIQPSPPRLLAIAHGGDPHALILQETGQ